MCLNKFEKFCIKRTLMYVILTYRLYFILYCAPVYYVLNCFSYLLD